MKAFLYNDGHKLAGLVELGEPPWPPVLRIGGVYYARTRNESHRDYKPTVPLELPASAVELPRDHADPVELIVSLGGDEISPLNGRGGRAWAFSTPMRAGAAERRVRVKFPEILGRLSRCGKYLYINDPA